MKNFKKGFTLIELLVVVAIIGILASVVLASLNTARAKGSDAAIKANLDNMRAQAAIYYDDNSSTYGTSVTCVVTTGTPPTFAAGCTNLFGSAGDGATMRAGLSAASSSSGGSVYANTDSTGNAYAIEAGLKAVTNTSWCVDSSGKSELVSAAVASPGTACP